MRKGRESTTAATTMQPPPPTLGGFRDTASRFSCQPSVFTGTWIRSQFPSGSTTLKPPAGRRTIYTLHDSHVGVLLEEAVYHVEHIRLGFLEPVSANKALSR